MSNRVIPFNLDVYNKLGVCAALVYGYIESWCASHERDGINYHDGRYWMFDTEEAISNGLGIRGTSARSVYSALNALREHGFIIRSNYNQARRNRTWWYAINSGRRDISQSLRNDNLAIRNSCEMQLANLARCNRPVISLTNNSLSNAHAHARTKEDNPVRISPDESATAGTLGPDTDWRTALSAALAHNAEYEADALTRLDAMEREARADPSYPHRDAQLAFCSAQRTSVRANRRLFDAMDALSCGLDDPAIDLAPCDTTFTDADGNPFCYFDLCDERYGDLNWTVQKFYVETCWAENREPTADDFATPATQQWLADCFAAEVALRDAEYDELDAESDDLDRAE